MDAEALRATNHAKDTLCKAPTKELQDEFWDHQEACKAPKVQLYSRYTNHDFTLKIVSGKEERIFRGNSRFLLAAIFILKQVVLPRHRVLYQGKLYLSQRTTPPL